MYTISLSVTYSGTIQIEASSAEEALEIAKDNFFVNDSPSYSSSDEIKDFDMDMKPDISFTHIN